MLLINAKINTITNGVIDNGYIYILNGKISALGSMEELNINDENIVDIKGMDVYPGFIDAHTHLGMFENALTFEGDDGNEDNDPVTPHLRAIDAVNPMDLCFVEGLKAGVTSVVTGPGSANPIGGQFVAMKTYGKRIDEMIIKAPLAIKFALGENPKTVYNEKNQSPRTRMATAALIREQLFKAKEYLNQKEKAQDKDSDTENPEFDAKCEALLPLLKGEIKAHFHAHRADDIFTAIRISKEFNIKYVIIHATEGHIIADDLKMENTQVLSGPFLCDRSKPELSSLTPSSPAGLSKAKVETAIITDHPVIPIQYLPVCAALAVREGMDKFEAIKSITINPARICEIDDRVGSIEVSKDADLVVFDQDPLLFTSKPKIIFCDGKIIEKNL